MTEILLEEKSLPTIHFEPNFEPLIEKTSSKESLKIRLIQNITDVNSDLWIAFKSFGSESALDNFASHDRTKALVNCAASGLNIADNEVLFIDSVQDLNQAFYLVNPPIAGSELAWIQKIVKCCVDFKVSNIGLYFDAALVPDNFENFFKNALQEIFSQLALRELYILAFRNNYNLILNAVLETQKNSTNPNLEFDVYH